MNTQREALAKKEERIRTWKGSSPPGRRRSSACGTNVKNSLVLCTRRRLESPRWRLRRREVCLRLEASEKANVALTERLTEVEHLAAALQRTKSWRYTAPMRLVNRHLQESRKALVRIPAMLQHAGGLGMMVRKAHSLYRREGLGGFKSRWGDPTWPPRFLVRAEEPNRVPATSISYDPLHGYTLTEGPAGYVYIPPCRPRDLEQRLEGIKTPVFSILMPAYNTPPELLSKAIESVTSQWYPHWQLIIADDAGTSLPTREVLARIDDPRISVLNLASNHGISGATNAALAQATGDFVVLLDHDDELTPDCLFELSLRIDAEDPDFVYSDEDKITPDGRFSEPHFKPDWSPDTMMSTMYVCHVSCIRRSLMLEVGGFRSAYDGCQDWDLVLRVTEKTNRISHIPKVLYHWRILDSSTAADIAAKPYVLAASRRVREDALKRRGLSGTVEPVTQVKGYFRVNYHLRGNPLVSIIIPTRDNGAVLRRCIDSVLGRTDYRNFEIILLDNGSVKPETLDILDHLAKNPMIQVVRHDAPFNFSELNNMGAARAAGELLLFLNDDTEVLSADWLQRLGGYAQLEHVGTVGAKLLYPGGRDVQHAGVLNLEEGPRHAFWRQPADTPGYFMRNLLEYNWLAVTGACLMIERQKFISVGKFNEEFPIAYNDIDLCMRLHHTGFYNVVCQAVRLIHHESASRGIDHEDPEKHTRLQQEKRNLYDAHPHYFQLDPFHSPNLHPNGINLELTAGK